MAKRYVLRNTSKYDVPVLGYTMHPGQSADMFVVFPKFTEEMMERTMEADRLWRFFERIYDVVNPAPPLRMAGKTVGAVVLPQRAKSLITIVPGEPTDEELRNATIEDEDALLQQLENDAVPQDIAGPPLAAKKEDDDGGST